MTARGLGFTAAGFVGLCLTAGIFTVVLVLHMSSAALPTLTCAEVERVLPSIAQSNGAEIGTVICKRVKEVGTDSYAVDAVLVQGSETRFWTFTFVANGWLVTHGEQTGSKVASPPPPA